MPAKIKKPDIKKTTQFVESWNAYGGLLTKAQAARMLDVTPGHINKSWKTINLEQIEIDGKKWITFQSLYKEFLKRKEKFE